MTTRQEQIPLFQPTIVDILNFERLLGTGAEYTTKHLLTCFEMSEWVKEENGELTQENLDGIILAKNVLMRQIILKQIETHGQFKITSPFENTCGRCGGAGEIYKFIRSSQKVTCMKCKKSSSIREFLISKDLEPDGYRLVDCKDGIIIPDLDNPKELVMCQTCRGKSEIKKFAICAELKSTTQCRYCHGKGYVIPKPENLPDNPVMGDEVAKHLKTQISTDLGKEIQSAEIEIVKQDMIDPGTSA